MVVLDGKVEVDLVLIPQEVEKHSSKEEPETRNFEVAEVNVTGV